MSPRDLHSSDMAQASASTSRAAVAPASAAVALSDASVTIADSSVVLLAELLNTVDALRSARTQQLARIAQLERQLDSDLFEQLMARAKELRPNVARDGRGLTELE